MISKTLLLSSVLILTVITSLVNCSEQSTSTSTAEPAEHTHGIFSPPFFHNLVAETLFQPFDRLHSLFSPHPPETSEATLDNLEDKQLGLVQHPFRLSLRPAMECHDDENAQHTVCTFELPGLRKEDVAVTLHDHLLTVSGSFDRKYKHTDTQVRGQPRRPPRALVSERRYGSFSRTFSIPRGVTAENISAKLEHGLLVLKLPKVDPKAAESHWAQIEVE